MKSRLILFTIACAFLPARAEKVSVDFDQGSHFSRFKTYCWRPVGDSQPGDNLVPNQIMQARIAAFIDEALAAKGLKRVASNGDITVGYQVSMTEEPVYTTFNDGWGWNQGFSTTTVQTIYHSVLVIDIWTAHPAQLLFQGISTQTISAHPSKNTKRFAKAVNEIFEKYPPQM